MSAQRQAVNRFLVIIMAALLAGCLGASPARMGMVKDPATGLQFGSVISNSIVTDPAFFKNRKIKVRVRNTSGDTAFDLNGFLGNLQEAYRAAGYEPTDGDDFGLLLDCNVKYSGQMQRNLAEEYALLGAAAGTIAGAAVGRDALTGGAIGMVSGATFGSIVGSFVTEDTYIIVARVTVAMIRQPQKESSKTIVFSRSPNPAEDEEERRYKEEERGAASIRKSSAADVAIFAGGTNVPQARISGEVRQRLVRIVSNFI